ncbi:MAG: type II secretion system F family protein [Firmicutes bacterium]|nr:type II secretion system F family protein [Bacillota bacterium]
MRFTYSASSRDGNIVQGTLVAKSLAQAQDQLHQQGLFIIALAVSPDQTKIRFKLLARFLTQNSKIRFLIRFVHQLSTLSYAGLPFLTCIQIMADEENHPLYRETLTQLKHDVASGDSLATALAKHEYLFPQLVVQMTTTAEAAGKLEEIYSKLGNLYKHELAIRRKITATIFYPLLVLTLAIVGGIAISKIVLPQVEDLVAYSSTSWPLPTKILLYLGQPRGWYVLIITLSFLIPLVLILMYTSLGSKVLDYLKFHLPVLGPITLRYHWSRVCYCLGLSLDCGIPLLIALDIAEQAALSRSLAAAIRQIKAGTQAGLNLSYQLRTIKSVPLFLIPLVHVGEETAQLAIMLQRAAVILYKELEHSLDMVVTWLEPLLIVIAGGIVGFIIMGLMMPLFTLVDSLG